MSRALGAAGTALIKGFEKLRLVGYADEGGVPTAGWGHTGSEVVVGQAYALSQANAWFIGDTSKAVAAVDAEAPASITQNQFDALVSFGFNVGINAEAHSTLMRLVQSGDLADAAAEFGKWNHVNGVVSDGLTARRAAERALFETPKSRS